MIPASRWKSTETLNVPQVHRYNNRAQHLQGQDLMENHVATIKRLTSTPSNPETLVRPAGEDWSVIDQATSNLTLQPGRGNVVLCPQNGKFPRITAHNKGTQQIKMEQGHVQ